ncbi:MULTISPECIES: type III secretion protein [Pseudomonas]|uniref:Type III secretion protein RspF n=1 Tax=Pseudomonas fluorescens (strain Q2-87) TaxID=1038922 RepID=J2E799_PSEFQ|nr:MULTISPECIES: type III secretion protein [Pseudomonas]EJK98939.1 type III secretion protein RspF [Pseudomonas fluorescens Q2-87]
MSSTDAVQRRLDTYFQRATDNVNDAAMNAADTQSLDDMHAFVTSMNGMSVAVNAATQQTTAHHNLAKAIIDAMP